MGLKCDFCATLEPEWICPAKDFNMGIPDATTGLMSASEGAWLACCSCAGHVRAGNRAALVTVAYADALKTVREREVDVTSQELAIIRTGIRDLHARFWVYREGEPRLLTDAERATFEAMPDTYVDDAMPWKPIMAPWVQDLADAMSRRQAGRS